MIQNTNNFNYDDITKDSMLHINKITNRFTLLVPVDKVCEEQIKNDKFISIDPGTKPFLTCLTNNSVIEIGNNIDPIMRKQFKKLEGLNKTYYNSKKAHKKLNLKMHKKLYNKIDDLHWKTINHLIKQQPNNIVIGNWSTKSSVNCKGNVEYVTKKIMLKVRYYQFLQRLKYKCQCSGINLDIVDESYTSKLCSHCGHEHEKLGTNKTFNCPNCKICIGRDINSTRNMIYAK
jgi:transposase, IS605 OrfB family, central region